jgi:hypothetical protein
LRDFFIWRYARALRLRLASERGRVLNYYCAEAQDGRSTQADAEILSHFVKENAKDGVVDSDRKMTL